MFPARSIRRKLVVGLALVLVMLVTLSISGLSGMWSLRQMVADLNDSEHGAPRREDLVAALGRLAEPLLSSTPAGRAELKARLDDVRDQVDDFAVKLERMPRTRTTLLKRPISRQLLDSLRTELDTVDQLVSAGPQPAGRAREVNSRVALMIGTARSLPDPRAGLSRQVVVVDSALASRTRWLIASSLIAILLFAGLVHGVYRWLFVPIHTLYEGARRVAQGDFDFRVKLDTRDEMAELGESFNLMTARFQDTADDLDQQVRDRSRQLVRSERLVGVGFLAAGVAHEINNPLAAIAMATESLEKRAADVGDGDLSDEDRDVMRQYLGMIGREAFRCQGITRKLLDFARGREEATARHDLVSLVDDVLELVRHMSRFADRMIVFEARRPCWLDISGSQITQVVLNLVANGLESTDPGGRVEIELSERTDQVTLTVTDDGCGMTPETIENLFEPFFTTKDTGQGTGLGLSISHRIVVDHRGTLEAESDGPGRGSCFRLQLPRGCAVPR